MGELGNALRQLRRRPGLSIMIVVTLAIGIGVTTGIFSLFHQVLIRPLPVPEPERLVNLAPPQRPVFSYPMFRNLEAQQDVFTGLAAYDEIPANLAYEGRPRSGSAMAVSAEYFEVLGLRAALGRLIGPQDEPALDEARVAVLSHDYWSIDLGGDPGVIGRAITVNGQELTVVGVAPAGFSGTVFGVRPQAFVPLTLRFLLRGVPRDQAQNRFAFALMVFARLRPEIGLEQASAGINALHDRIIAELEPSPNAQSPAPARTIALEPGARGERADITNDFARPLSLLLGVTLVVLVVVCSNVASLLLARGAARANEMTIRAAIGADRLRLISQLLTEAGVLALIGGIASLLVASLTVRVIELMVPDSLVSDIGVGLTPAVMLFAAAASLSTVVLFGLAPAIQASSLGARLVVSNPFAPASGARGMTRFRNLLTTSQLAFSVVLLVLAALFAQSLANIVRVNLGVDVDTLVTFNVAPRLNGYGPEQTAAAYERIGDALASQPDVTGVATSMIPLLSGSRFVRMVEGFDVGPDIDRLVPVNMVSRGFFATLGVPMLRGRDFADTDTASSPRVVIVNESFARRFGLGDDAIGRRFRPAGADADLEIVGLVADAAHSGSGVKQAVPPQFYQPSSQVDFSPSRYFYVRTNGDPAALVRAVPRVVAGLDQDLPVANLRTMSMQFADDVYVDRLVTLLSAGFAILATLLTAIGLYGSLSYTVTQRTRELGLRLALGAEPARLRAMVLKQVGVMVAIGCTVGVAAAIVVVGLAEAILFGVSGYDPIAFIAAVSVLCLVALTAGYLPARRASSVAPMAALRYE